MQDFLVYEIQTADSALGRVFSSPVLSVCHQVGWLVLPGGGLQFFSRRTPAGKASLGEA